MRELLSPRIADPSHGQTHIPSVARPHFESQCGARVLSANLGETHANFSLLCLHVSASSCIVRGHTSCRKGQRDRRPSARHPHRQGARLLEPNTHARGKTGEAQGAHGPCHLNFHWTFQRRHSLLSALNGTGTRALDPRWRDQMSEPPPQSDEIAHRLLTARDWQDRPEFDDLCQWWREDGFGLCALVGIGGAGKTAIADRFLQVLPGGYPDMGGISGAGFQPADRPAQR